MEPKLIKEETLEKDASYTDTPSNNLRNRSKGKVYNFIS